MFTLFSQVLGGVDGVRGWDYTRLAHILDLFFLCLSSFQLIQPEVNFKYMTSRTQ